MSIRALNAVKSIALISTTIALLAPLSSHAETTAATAAMDACITQFIAGYLADRQGVVTVQKESRAPSPLASIASTSGYTIHVSAKGRSTGTQLASATCVVSNRGVVLSMRSDESDKAAAEKVAKL